MVVVDGADDKVREFAETCPCPVGDRDEYAAAFSETIRRIGSDAGYAAKAELFKALADEKRLRILAFLREREMCVCELTFAVGVSQSNVSHHVSILERAGLVSKRRDGKLTYYRAADSPALRDLLGS